MKLFFVLHLKKKKKHNNFVNKNELSDDRHDKKIEREKRKEIQLSYICVLLLIRKC